MDIPVAQAIDNLLSEYAARDPELVSEVRTRLSPRKSRPLWHAAVEPVIDKAIKLCTASNVLTTAVVYPVGFHDNTPPALPEADARLVAETIVRPRLRPVLMIQDNTLLMNFFGEDTQVWRDRLYKAKPLLDAAIPAVGRIEVTNHPGYTWVGSGWLVSDEVVVTNRHVAREFARRDNKQFVFKAGLNGPMSCRVDFLEEFQRSRSFEFQASEVLWIAPVSEADIAFLRIVHNSNGLAPPRPVPLSAAAATQDQFIATIGYPARDDEFPDQDLVRKVFGEVYDKKRLAPGQVIQFSGNELLHDCSTLGGNSGSVVLDLESGEAVALHYAGLFPRANYAVPAAVVKDRLQRVLRGEFASSISSASSQAVGPAQPQVAAGASPPVKATFVIPLEITVSLGTASVRLGATTVNAGTDGIKIGQQPSFQSQYEAALIAAKNALKGDKEILDIRLGYRFRDEWITNERAIVVEMDESKTLIRQRIPEEFNGVPVEIRMAPLLDRLRAEGIAVPPMEERVAKGTYRKPPLLTLTEIKDLPMEARFHVSPDSGFPNLREFFSRTKNRITATMYEFDSEHVLASLLEAVSPENRSLTMVTQKEGTADAVDKLAAELGERFDHAWASVANAISVDTNLLFPMAYHIKVAVRDREEVWLSSGNWKDSGQPDIDPAGLDQTSWGPLNKNNREWHVIIKNDTLAALFEDYIKFDLSEARRVPLPEGPQLKWPDVFISEPFKEKQPETRAQYFDPLVVKRPLHIQPLLTPDNFIKHVTGLIEDAERSILVQNQSFNLLAFDDDGGPGNNEQAFYNLLVLLRDRQETHDVKIIFRDAREFPGNAGNNQKKLLERLKDFGFDMNNIKLLRGCHTKGVIVDSDKVLLGSHNWTNQGALYNRDASLIVYDAEVASYFESIFLFDWEHRARQRTDVELPGVSWIAHSDDETPPGMRRVSLAEILYDLIE
ncbi:MAG TPA: phospholipase D-like domain-containing protein [Pyrinomonadaceae bacterium]|nr:phospholipase D-like domain-containing protein [Pyrinomonadaceae bacterium]